MEFKYYTCTNGIATPKNPSFDKIGKYPPLDEDNKNWDQFNKWALENTVSCSEDLSGEYAKDSFGEPVVEWCIHVPMGHAFWAKTTQAIADKWNVDFPYNKRKTRQYLPLKPVEKDTRDASHFEILSNVIGKEQDGINKPILKLWGEVENFYGDPHKNETGRQLLLRIQDEYNISFKEPEVKQQFWEWISVNPDADIADTDLQHFEQYFIVMAENGQVRQAVFCDWQTEGVDNTWIINDEEYPLTFATHYQRVIYPSPPKSI